MMMMREFFGILGLGFPFYSISLLTIRTIGKRRGNEREEKRNLRRDGKGRGQQRPASPRGISPRGYIFFYFIIMTGKLTMTFSLVSLQRSWIGRGACHFSFLFPFSFFFSFSFGRGISIIMIMIIITIVMAMALYQSERKMENGSSSSSSSKNVLTFLLLLLLFASATGLQNTNIT